MTSFNQSLWGGTKHGCSSGDAGPGRAGDTATELLGWEPGRAARRGKGKTRREEALRQFGDLVASLSHQSQHPPSQTPSSAVCSGFLLSHTALNQTVTPLAAKRRKLTKWRVRLLDSRPHTLSRLAMFLQNDKVNVKEDGSRLDKRKKQDQ